MDTKKKIVRNTMANYIGQFWLMAVSFILFPFIVNHVGLTASGIWLLISSITGYFGLLDLGIGSSLTKYVAEYHAKEDTKQLNEVINTTFFLFLGVGVIAAIGLLVFGELFLISLFSIPMELIGEAKMIVYIVSISMLLRFPMGVFGGVLMGLQRYDINALIGIIISIPRIVLIVAFLTMGYGIVALVAIETFVSVIGWILSTYYAKRFLPSMSIKPVHFKNKMVTTLLSFGGAVFIMQVCGIIILQTDQIVIGTFLTMGAITFYAAAFKIYLLVRRIPELVLPSIFPAASELDAKQNSNALHALFIRGSKYMTAAFLSVVIPVIILSKSILTVWMGHEFASMYLVLWILLAGLFFNINHLVPLQILQGMGRIRMVMILHVVWAISNLALSIILVQKIGLIGIALGTTLPLIPLEFFYTKETLKVLKISWKTYLHECLLKIYPQAACAAIILYIMTQLYYPSTLIEIAFYGLIGVSVYIVMFYISGLEESERKDIMKTSTEIFIESRQMISNRVNK